MVSNIRHDGYTEDERDELYVIIDKLSSDFFGGFGDWEALVIRASTIIQHKKERSYLSKSRRVKESSFTVSHKPPEWTPDGYKTDARPTGIEGSITALTDNPIEALRLASLQDERLVPLPNMLFSATTNDDGDGYFTHTYVFKFPQEEPTVSVTLTNNLT